MAVNPFRTRTEQASLRRGMGRTFTIIADDLTGACDAAVAFAPVSAEVRVSLDGSLQGRADVWAVSTDTRDVGPLACEATLSHWKDRVPYGAEVFKKVDSVFRGNTFFEIATSVRCFPDRLAVIAPAYPALGRTMVDGVLHIDDLGNSRHLPIASMLSDLGCPTLPLPASSDASQLAPLLERTSRERSSALLCDAQDQSHLRALVEAARMTDQPILWVGSGGLAHALAAELPVQPEDEGKFYKFGQTIFFVGSDHPVTRGQILHLQRLTGMQSWTCGGPAQACDQGLLLSVPRGEDEIRVRDAISGVKPDEVGCLFMTGGDTARLVCRALGITSLRLRREFAPGVPLGVAEGGRFDGVPVVLKSGAFGSRDLMRHVLEAFSMRKEVVSA